MTCKSRIVTWIEYQKKIVKLASLINESYDIILGIFQGGYIVAMSLADLLIKAKVGGIISSIGNAKKIVVLTDEKCIGMADLQGKKILLVDEVVESGYSIMKCKCILNELGVEKIGSACIYCNINSNEKIDYYAEEFVEGVNFIFPWRANRDCESLLTDVMEYRVLYSEKELMNKIRDAFGIELSEQVVYETLNKKEGFFVRKEDKWELKSEL